MVKCNIFETKINYELLNTSLEKYINSQTGDYIRKPNFIIMNTNTKYKMWKDCAPTENWNRKGISYAEYQGIPIAICDKLEDGDIEII